MIFFAHRGDSGHYMENTAEAFRSSLRRGFRAMELDLVTLKDGEIVVFHDDTLQKFFSDPRRPGDLTLSEFRHIMPDLLTYDEFREEFAPQKVVINLEVKDSIKTLEKIEKSLSEYNFPVISSFRREIIDLAIEKGLNAAYLFHSRKDLLANFPTLKNNRIHLNYRIVLDKELPEHSLEDFDVYCYTVNDISILKKLSQFPFVKGVFTDDQELPWK